MYQTTSRIAALIVLVGLTAAPASAAEPDVIARSLVESVATLGRTEGGFAGARQDGDSVIVDGFHFTHPRWGKVSIPELTIRSPRPREGGGFSAESISFAAGSMESLGLTIRWQEGRLESPDVPSAAEIERSAARTLFSDLRLEGIAIEHERLDRPVRIASIETTVEEAPAGSDRPLRARTRIEDINFTAQMVLHSPLLARFRAWTVMLEQLGYEELVADVTIEGHVRNDRDGLEIEPVQVDIADVGTFTLGADFNHVPVSALVDPSNWRAVSGKVELAETRLRFENHGLVDRLLDAYARMMGRTREQSAETLSALLPIIGELFRNPSFSASLQDAGSAFMKDPKSITFASTLSEPVLLTKVMAAARGAPRTLPEVLAIDVKANQ